MQDGAELIIGPLFAQEVTAAAPVARQANVPMIAFSSDEKVAGNGVYLLSFLPGRDVPRIVSYALSQGKRNFAVLVPQSPYGRLAEEAFAKSVTRGGGQAVVRATFPTGDANAMLGPVRQVANAIKPGQKVDALFLPAGPEDLQSLAPLLASSDVTGARLQFLGTGQWDYPNVGREKALVGGWYAAPDPKGWSNFSASYAKTYGAAPPRIASFAYDAVSLAVSLSPNPPGQRYTTAQLHARAASPASMACSACYPTARASAASPSSSARIRAANASSPRRTASPQRSSSKRRVRGSSRSSTRRPLRSPRADRRCV